ncbi:MAG TPA: hypothetical protein VF920_11235 [Dongiaceae bacterium]
MLHRSKSVLSICRRGLRRRRGLLTTLLHPKQFLRRLGAHAIAGGLRRLTRCVVSTVGSLLVPQAELVLVPVRASRHRRWR